MTIEDRDIFTKFKTEFIEDLNNCELKYQFLSEVDRSNSIKIFGDLICKGWANEAIPVTHEKKSWISRVFSSIFE